MSHFSVCVVIPKTYTFMLRFSDYIAELRYFFFFPLIPLMNGSTRMASMS